ncbi:MAG: hypothetical protein DCC71_24165, partial [Proteobacteria bacterium]
MALLETLGFGSFVVVSLVVGARLLALGRRTRELPANVLGVSLLFGGGVGYPLVVLGLRVLGPELAPFAVTFGNLCIHAGTIALALGTWNIFRAGERWPMAPVAAIVAVVALSFGLRLVHFRELPPPASVFWSSTGIGLAGYAWAAGEALQTWRRLRRRLALGLADPAATRRIGLWGAACACAVGMHVASLAGRLLDGGSMPPLAVGASSALGFAAALSTLAAFFPGR